MFLIQNIIIIFHPFSIEKTEIIIIILLIIIIVIKNQLW